MSTRIGSLSNTVPSLEPSTTPVDRDLPPSSLFLFLNLVLIRLLSQVLFRVLFQVRNPVWNQVLPMLLLLIMMMVPQKLSYFLLATICDCRWVLKYSFCFWKLTIPNRVLILFPCQISQRYSLLLLSHSHQVLFPVWNQVGNRLLYNVLYQELLPVWNQV
jgi:magnesium-transporting ATPase (P-type)